MILIFIIIKMIKIFDCENAKLYNKNDYIKLGFAKRSYYNVSRLILSS